MQLPLYLEATRSILFNEEKGVGAFLFSLKGMEKKHGLGLKEYRSFYFPKINARLFLKDEEWSELIDTAMAYAAEYIQKIRDSEFIENPDNCNKFCDYKDICRYAKK